MIWYWYAWSRKKKIILLLVSGYDLFKIDAAFIIFPPILEMGGKLFLIV
jgi:hypothetical protein